MFRKISKEDIELSQLKRFLANPTLRVVTTNVERGNDPPDFEITTGGKTVSIEITRLLDPELKEREEFRNRIIKQAAQLFQSKYDTNLYCLITFLNIRLDGGQPMFQRFSQQLFFEIEKIYLANKNTEFNITIERPEIESDFINTLRVRNTMEFNHWQYFTAYKVDWIDLERLKSIIETKERNIKKYTGTFDEHWLLLISNIGTKSSSNRFDFLDFGTIETLFHKIYVLKDMENEIITIK